MITVPAAFRAMPRWWHDQDGQDWIEALPILVADQCRRWDLDVDGEPLHGSNALVVPVRDRHGQYVLRLAPPGDDIAQEAAALRWWDGRGTVRLFDLEVESGAMLLERLDGSRTLTSEPLSVAIPVLAQLVAELAVPAPADALSTAAIAAGHVQSLERDWESAGRPTPRSQLDLAMLSADARASASASRLAVDGDLHCDQVLAADREPWLVVDPVLLQGDPEYDFARVLWDRLDELPSDSEVLAMFDLFVESAQVPAERARSWMVLRSMSYLLWGIERGLTWDPPKCRRLLDLLC